MVPRKRISSTRAPSISLASIIFKSQLESRPNPAQKQCVCGGSEFAINILKKIGLISEKSRAVPKLESKVYIIVI